MKLFPKVTVQKYSHFYSFHSFLFLQINFIHKTVPEVNIGDLFQHPPVDNKSILVHIL